MSLLTEKLRKQQTFDIPSDQTNAIFIAGQLGTSTSHQTSLEQEPIGPQLHRVQCLASTAPAYSAAVPGFVPGVVCVPVSGGQASALDCLGEVADCNVVGEAAVVRHGGQVSFNSERSASTVTPVNLPVRSSIVEVGYHDPVAHLSPSHTRLSSSSNPGTQ